MENLIEKLKKQIQENLSLAEEYKKKAKEQKTEEAATNQWTIYVAIRETTQDIEKIIQKYEEQRTKP